MTAGHLVFTLGMSAYILVAMRYEERDLVNHIGERYQRYRQEVPALVPLPGRRFEG
jgi:protein-S-isoprenylcysteine O-methyltransferase Ste14